WPWWTRERGPSIAIPWSEVRAFSPIPAVRRERHRWVFFDGRPIPDAPPARKDLPFFVLMVVLHDRHALMARCTRGQRWWLRPGSRLKPLYGSDDSPLDKPGILELELAARPLRRDPGLFARLLDLLAVHASFEVIYFED
ncbi:MAG: hypothetical protein AAFU79_25495, partial [Myxococcota bacterium]